MNQSTLWVGLDVHAADIFVACAEGDGRIDSLGRIVNDSDSVKKLFRRLRKRGRRIHACYEAGPCGYVLYRDLASQAVRCDVVAPTLIPQRPGDRVKTDRRDAKRLVEFLRAGQLTPAWVPDEAHEAFRDLIRCREAAVSDQTRTRNRLGKFLLRHGRKCSEPGKRWSKRYMRWLERQTFEHHASAVTFRSLMHEVEHTAERLKHLKAEIERVVLTLPESTQALIDALQGLKGVALLTAVTIVAEVGDLSRFAHPSQLMSYAGMVPGEHSSGSTIRRGRITKAGNAHLRRVLGEAAWQYARPPRMGAPLKRRQIGLSQEVTAISWRAQHRLHQRYRTLTARGKDKRKVVVAVGRELLGFIWAIGREVELEQRRRRAA